MANIKSAIKRATLSEELRVKNAAARSTLKTSIRRFEETLTANPEQAEQALRNASRSLDKAASKGLIHKNKAARKKSRLAKKLARTNA